MVMDSFWGYRQSSDVASRVSSDGSSFINNHRLRHGLDHHANDDESDVEIKLLVNELGRMKEGEIKHTSVFDDSWKRRTQYSQYEEETATVSTQDSPKSVMDMSSFASQHSEEPRKSPRSKPMKSQQRRATRTIVGSRRQRKRQIHTMATTGWSCWEMDQWNPTTCWSSEVENSDSHKEVTVVIEATSICDRDLRQRQQVDCHASFMLDSTATAGTNLVGVIHKGHSTSKGIPAGTRVAAVVPQGAHARYLKVPHHLLHKVPKHLDSAEVAAIVATYLPAFCALHHGQSQSQRYSRTSLKGKRLFITHCTTLEAQAAIRCAKLAGCKDITITVPPEYVNNLQEMDVTVLDEEQGWASQVKGRMDVVLDYQFPQHFKAVKAAVAKRGRLICQSNSSSNPLLPNQDTACCFHMENLMEYLYLVYMKRATLFDFADEVRRHKAIHEDLEHLLKWLSTRLLRPEIDCFIGLSEVSHALDVMGQRPPFGSIICEPWKE